jgi:hypothetical protein
MRILESLGEAEVVQELLPTCGFPALRDFANDVQFSCMRRYPSGLSINVMLYPALLSFDRSMAL